MLLLLVLLLAICIRSYGLGRPYVWGDEAFSIRMSLLPFEEIGVFASHDVHPPLYYYLLHVWMGVWGSGAIAVRALSVLLGSLAVVGCAMVVKELSDWRQGLWCGVLIAFLPVAVRYSQEARMYALFLFFVVASLFMLIRWVKDPGSNSYLSAYALFVVCLLYTHYFAVFVIFSHWAYLVWLVVAGGGKENYFLRRSWWLANGVIVLMFIPWLIVMVCLFSAFDVTGSTGAFNWVPTVTLESFPSLLWSFLILNDGQGLKFWLFWGLPLVMLLLSVVAVCRDASELKVGALFVLHLFVPIVTVILLSFFVPMWVVRYLAFSAVAVPVVVVVSIFALGAGGRVSILLLLVIVQLPGVYFVYQQKDDFNYSRNAVEFPLQQIASVVGAKSSGGDKIVVEGGVWYYSLMFYGLPDQQTLLYESDWKQNASSRPKGYGSLSLLEPVRKRVFLYDPEKLSDAAENIWWITSRSDMSALNLPARWTQVDAWVFGKMHVLLFRVNAPPFELRQPATQVGANR
ncbi:glycosyltransferase family 39 protein [Pseudomonas sp. NPDC089534]|uniref:glycosyltransferase family 39 protein n=1 Tax=Pseudomonas sp. NPDC089534 TaxID=3364468 RepID=UPI003821AFA0